jgi:hypothetical protein
MSGSHAYSRQVLRKWDVLFNLGIQPAQLSLDPSECLEILRSTPLTTPLRSQTEAEPTRQIPRVAEKVLQPVVVPPQQTLALHSDSISLPAEPSPAELPNFTVRGLHAIPLTYTPLQMTLVGAGFEFPPEPWTDSPSVVGADRATAVVSALTPTTVFPTPQLTTSLSHEEEIPMMSYHTASPGRLLSPPLEVQTPFLPIRPQNDLQPGIADVQISVVGVATDPLPAEQLVPRRVANRPITPKKALPSPVPHKFSQEEREIKALLPPAQVEVPSHRKRKREDTGDAEADRPHRQPESHSTAASQRLQQHSKRVISTPTPQDQRVVDRLYTPRPIGPGNYKPEEILVPAFPLPPSSVSQPPASKRASPPPKQK